MFVPSENSTDTEMSECACVGCTIKTTSQLSFLIEIVPGHFTGPRNDWISFTTYTQIAIWVPYYNIFLTRLTSTVLYDFFNSNCLH